ncbi:MAG: Eco57I restriction-modification methylase domain-containing protein [Candidatus Hodarchaeota archaeon]
MKQASRKRIAAYYTCQDVAHLLAGLTVKETSQYLLDPACGPGRLLNAAIQQKKTLFGQRFQAILGLDSDPRAIKEAQRSLFTFLDGDSAQIQCIDAFEWAERNFDIAFDLILMNPPFTRKQLLGPLRPNQQCFPQSESKSGLSSGGSGSAYYEYFLQLADKLLKRNGRIGTILPVSFLRGKNPRSLRGSFLRTYTIEYLILRLDKPNFSEDTALREVLLVAQKTPPCKVVETKIVFIKRLTAHTLNQLRETFEFGFSQDVTALDFLYRFRPQHSLDPKNLYRAVAFTEPALDEIWSKITKSAVLLPIKMAEIKVRSKNEPSRGGGTFTTLTVVSQDHNSSRDSWVLESISDSGIYFSHVASGKPYSLAWAYVWPTFRRIPHRSLMDVSDLDEYVVHKRPEDASLIEKLPEGIRWEIWRRYLDQRRSHLLLVERVDLTAPGSRLLAYFSESPRAWSRVSASLSGLSVLEAKIACLWFNSSFFLLNYLFERDETRGGYVQLHKYIIEELPILLPQGLSSENIVVLEKLFDELRSYEFPSLLEQYAALVERPDKDLQGLLSREKSLLKLHGQGFLPRQKLDSLLLEILEVASINLEKLYSMILKELLLLRKMMRNRH